MTKNAHYAEIVHLLPSVYQVYSVSESAQCRGDWPKSRSGRRSSAGADFRQKGHMAYLLQLSPIMSTCLQGIRERNYKGREVKRSYDSAVRTYVIIKILRRNVT